MECTTKNVLFFLFLFTNLLFACTSNLKSETLTHISEMKVQTKTGMTTVSLQRMNLTREEKKKLRNQKRQRQAFNSTMRVVDSLVFAKIYVGNPPQEIPVSIDTGSSLLHVAVYECVKHKTCHSDKVYNPKKSKTFHNTSKLFNQYYGGGWLKSVFAYDDVSIKGIKVHHQKIGMVIHQNHILGKTGGIIGLAYPRKELPEGNLMENMIRQKILRQNVIGYYLGNEGGSVQFGYIDNTLIIGNFNKHKVIEKRRWVLHIDDLLINGKPLNLCKKKLCYGLVDTGTSELTMPEQYFKIVSKHIHIDKYCKGIEKLPVVTYVIDGKHYDMKPEDYIEKWTTRKHKTKKCNRLINSFDLSNNDKVWLLGEPFIFKFYPVFDRDNNMIHLGLKKRN